MSERWFCIYRSNSCMDKGVRVPRAFGGKKLRCHHALGRVLHVARKWLPARPDATAFVYEVFPLEGDPPLGRAMHDETRSALDVVADAPLVVAATQLRRWYTPNRRTRLELFAEIRHAEEYVVTLTEALVERRSA